jgi:transposase
MSDTELCAGSFRNLPRRRFTREFKRDVVEHLLRSGRTVAEVAREHDLHPNQLCRWRNDYRRRVSQTVQPAANTALVPVTVSEPCRHEVVPDIGREDACLGEAGTAPCLVVALPKATLTVYAQCPESLLRLAMQALR